jgi:type II secretory pathway pseudopilin PulG
MRTPRHSRSGFTLLEALIATVVVTLVLGNVVFVLGSSNKAYEKESSASSLELQLDQTLDRIVLALMGASLESLDPGAQNPVFHDQLEFTQRLGVQDGQAVDSVPERIEMVLEGGEVMWRESPDEPSERAVLWSRWVRRYLEGEVPNGIDDNGNGLVDESGLSFVIESSRITIYLSLERVDADGNRVTHSRNTIVHCRN